MSKASQKQFQQQMMRVQQNRINNKRMKENYETTLILVSWVLHDKFGFGNKRLIRLQDELKVIIDNYNEGLIDAKDLIDQLYEETGIKI